MLMESNSELSAVQAASIESSIQQTSNATVSKIEGNATLLKTILDAHHDVQVSETRAVLCEQKSSRQQILSKLDTQYQEARADKRAREHVTTKKLDLHHELNQEKFNKAEQSLVSILDTETKGLRRQNRIAQTTARTHTQTQRISTDLRRANKSSFTEYKYTQQQVSGLTNEVRGLRVAIVEKASAAKKIGGKVQFFGENRDMIMGGLRTVHESLTSATDQILSTDKDVHTKRFCFRLEDEVKRLLSSAAQEAAATYTGSTATPFDKWSYTDHHSIATSERKPICKASSKALRAAPVHGGDQVRRWKPWQTVKLSTPAGKVRISYRSHRFNMDGLESLEELTFSLSPHDNKAHHIQLYFTYRTVPYRRPQLCAQLNIFTVIPHDRSSQLMYWKLFGRGSLSEIDSALRSGTISPYYVTNGINYFTMVIMICSYGHLKCADR